MISKVISRDDEFLVALRMSGFEGVFCADSVSYTHLTLPTTPYV